MWFSKLLPRDGNFFELFNQHAARTAEGSRAFMEMMQGPPEKSQRAMNAMLQMRKLDVAKLRLAYDGAVAAR